MNNLKDKCVAMAKEIFDELGSGFDEPIYQKAFEVELRLQGLHYENIKIIPIYYKEYNVGEGKLDLHISDEDGNIILVELKAIKETISPKEETQLRTYLKMLGLKNGLLINFPQAGRKGVPDVPEIVEVRCQ